MAFNNSLSQTTFADIQKEQVGVMLTDVRSANSEMSRLLAEIRKILANPNITATDIAQASNRLTLAIRAFVSIRKKGFEVVRKFLPSLFGKPFGWGDANDPDDQRILQQVIELDSALAQTLKIERDIADIQQQLRNRASDIEEGRTVNDRITEQLQSEQNDNTDNEGNAIRLGSHSANSQRGPGKDKSNTQNPETGSISESANRLATRTNNEPVILRQARENLAADRNPTIVNEIDSEDRVTTDVGNNDQQYGDVTYKNAFFKPIVTQQNPLLQFAHYTYNIGIYLQTPEQYVTMITTGNRSTQGLLKVLESGGTGAVNGSDAIFPDIFIEDLEIQTLMMGNNPGAHNAVDLNFTIIEPMGFTFLQKLRELCTANNMYGLTNQHYLMVISFKGYDENGNEVTPANAEAMSKYIPFKFSKITTTVRTGAVQYACMATPPNYQIGQSVKRAAIRFNVELAGRTLNDIFNADGSESTSNTNSSYTADTGREFDDSGGYQAYAKRNEDKIKASRNFSSYQPPQDSGPKLRTQGVIKALNQEQIELVRNQKQSLPDIYRVEFKDDLGSFKVVRNEALQLNKKDTPMDATTTQAKEATQQTGMDTSIKKFSTVAGMPMMEFIDKMMRSSDYITKQQNYQIDGKTSRLVRIPGAKPFLQWYNISTVVKPLKFDSIRKDYAYDITYVISKKKILDTYSAYFNKADYLGVHKNYRYWFTGENTEVIDFEQELNAAFYVAMDNRVPEQEQDIDGNTLNESTRAVQGNDEINDNGDAAEKVSGILYSPVDFAKSIMTVFGDPDYIQQSEIFYEPGYYDPFMPDGSVNVESQEVLYSIYFRTMEDYNDRTGEAVLLDPQLKSEAEIKATTLEGQDANQALIYRLIRATNRFSEGKFTQELEGLIREFDQKEIATAQYSRPIGPAIGPAKIVNQGKRINLLQDQLDLQDKRRIQKQNQKKEATASQSGDNVFGDGVGF